MSVTFGHFHPIMIFESKAGSIPSEWSPISDYYTTCRHAECRYAECLYAKCHYAESRYAKCHYAESRYAEVVMPTVIRLNVVKLSVVVTTKTLQLIFRYREWPR